MLNLFLPPDPVSAPQLSLPRFAMTAPGMGVDMAKRMQEDLALAHSLRDPFLTASKKAFGERLRETPSYKGLLFALPFFTAKSLIATTQADRDACFGVFSGYLVESREDSGVVLMVRDPEFDEELSDLIEGMRQDGHVVPGLTV